MYISFLLLEKYGRKNILYSANGTTLSFHVRDIRVRAAWHVKHTLYDSSTLASFTNIT